MFRLARWLALWLAAGVLLLVAIGFAARWHDGPIGPFPGGAMTGDVVRVPVRDWGALLPANEDFSQHVELQVWPGEPRSITIGYIVRGGKLYVLALLGARKTWPALVTADERVILRAGKKLYPLRAVRVTDPAELEPLAIALGELEPGTRADPDALPTWYFRLEPPREMTRRRDLGESLPAAAGRSRARPDWCESPSPGLNRP